MSNYTAAVLQLLLLALMVIALGESADVTSTTNILAYATSGCPSGWVDVGSSSTYKGRVLVGATTGIGTLVGTAGLTSDGSSPTHSHASWSLLCPQTWGKIDSSNYPWLAGVQNYDTAPYVVEPYGSANLCNYHYCTFDSPVNKWAEYDQTLSQANSVMTSVTSDIPLVTLQLCQFNSGLSFNVPMGIVAFFTASTSTCPTGFTDFADATGRVMVFADSDVSVTSNNIGGGAAITSGAALGAHTHTVNSVTINTPYTLFNGQNYGISDHPNSDGSTPTEYKSTATFTASAPTSSDGIGLPHVQLRACKATSVGSGLGREPPSALIFYYDGDTCPGFWRDASLVTQMTNLTGRIPVVRSTSWSNPSLTIVGSDSITKLNGTYSTGTSSNYNMTHSHIVSATSASLPYLSDWCVYISSTTSFRCGYSNPSGMAIPVATGISFSTTTGTTTAPDIPFRIMRACMPPLPTLSPTASPSTSKPSVTPSTSTPSKVPSTSKPSSSPSHTPTKSPSRAPTWSKPSFKPTKSPSKSPSRAPSTSTPTIAPTWSKPSVNPTKSPSHSPSRSPTSSKPSSSPTKSPSKSPTTSLPSHAPSHSPSKSPSHAPSMSPLTSKPSASPIKTSQPTSEVAAAAQNGLSTTTVAGIGGGVAAGLVVFGAAITVWWFQRKAAVSLARMETLSAVVDNGVVASDGV